MEKLTNTHGSNFNKNIQTHSVFYLEQHPIKTLNFLFFLLKIPILYQSFLTILSNNIFFSLLPVLYLPLMERNSNVFIYQRNQLQSFRVLIIATFSAFIIATLYISVFLLIILDQSLQVEITSHYLSFPGIIVVIILSLNAFRKLEIERKTRDCYLE